MNHNYINDEGPQSLAGVSRLKPDLAPEAILEPPVHIFG
jgi:hypothetical protein